MIRSRFERSEEISIGPITLDINSARKAGWTETAITAAWEVIGHAEYFRSHYGFPVVGCGCIACDLTTPSSELFEGYAEVRKTWEYVGGDEVYKRRPLASVP